jgi:hypothetical protein
LLAHAEHTHGFFGFLQTGRKWDFQRGVAEEAVFLAELGDGGVGTAGQRLFQPGVDVGIGERIDAAGGWLAGGLADDAFQYPVPVEGMGWQGQGQAGGQDYPVLHDAPPL